jgi:hypothetical protein
MFIVDPKFPFPDPGSKRLWIPGPGSGSASKNLNIFNPKNCFYLSFRKYIPLFRIRIRITELKYF